MAHLSEEAADIPVFADQRFIPVELAALNLQISKRQLKDLLTAHGLSLYDFGQRSKRVRESDLRQLIRARAHPPVSHE
jgi:hypothetical protein